MLGNGRRPGDGIFRMRHDRARLGERDLAVDFLLMDEMKTRICQTGITISAQAYPLTCRVTADCLRRSP